MMLSFFHINQNWLAPVYSRVNVNVNVNVIVNMYLTASIY